MILLNPLAQVYKPYAEISATKHTCCKLLHFPPVVGFPYQRFSLRQKEALNMRHDPCMPVEARMKNLGGLWYYVYMEKKTSVQPLQHHCSTSVSTPLQQLLYCAITMHHLNTWKKSTLPVPLKTRWLKTSLTRTQECKSTLQHIHSERHDNDTRQQFHIWPTTIHRPSKHMKCVRIKTMLWCSKNLEWWHLNSFRNNFPTTEWGSTEKWLTVVARKSFSLVEQIFLLIDSQETHPALGVMAV